MDFRYLKLEFNGFDWDEFNSPKVQDRISLEKVEELFFGTVLIRADIRHSSSEPRFIAMGEVDGRILFVAYTERRSSNKLQIRVISARYIHSNSREEEFYEKAKKIFKKS